MLKFVFSQTADVNKHDGQVLCYCQLSERMSQELSNDYDLVEFLVFVLCVWAYAYEMCALQILNHFYLLLMNF